LILGGCWCCWLRLGHCVDWLNWLNGIAHAHHLTRLTSTKGKLTLGRGTEKERRNRKRVKRKLCGLVRRGG
jgi:hypothetical protein